MELSDQERPVPEWPQRACDIPSKRIYRYRQYRLDELRHLLKTGEIRFSEPRKFNDPWECCPRFYAPTEDLEGRLVIAIAELERRTKGKGDLDAVAKEAATTAIDNTKFEELARRLTESMQEELRARFRILCFSAVGDDPLMWGHYADGHRGVCLIFDTTTHAMGKAWRVNYSLQYPAVPLDLKEKDHFPISFLNKADHWKYEIEYRIVACINVANRPDFVACDNLSYVNVGAESLVGVICGHYFQDRMELTRLLASAPHEIGMYEARTRQDRYELDIVPIDK